VSTGNAHERCAFALPRSPNGRLRGVPRRRDGWWGISFLILLLLQASMVSVPTAEDPAASVMSFYTAHGTVIVIAQAIGALALIPLVTFARSLDRRARLSAEAGRSWIMPAAVIVVIAEIVTNAVPVVIVAMSDATAASAHTLSKVEDVADAILFVALALFAVAVARSQVRWLAVVGWASAGLMLAHATVSLFDVSALQAVAPLSFVAFVLLLSIRMLLPSSEPKAAAPAA
jgi:hypothetical protein